MTHEVGSLVVELAGLKMRLLNVCTDPGVRPNTNGVEARGGLRFGKGCADNMRGGEVDDAGGGVDAAVACGDSLLLVGAAG